jgi:pimeloyl-ACP methyl ester carboxylesterase
VDDPHAPLERPQAGIAGMIGRPTWREAGWALELLQLFRSPVWRGTGVPAGDGRPVLVVGGFGAGAGSSAILERWLRQAGYEVGDAAVGRNIGPSERSVSAIVAGVEELRRRTGRRVAIIGHSRGGHQARVAAVRIPEQLALLVTLGSPHRQAYPPHLSVRLPIEGIRMAGRFGILGRGVQLDEEDFHRDREAPFPPAVPFVSMWSRTDGIVDWRACRDPGAEDVELPGTHLGLAASAPAYRALAAVLGRPDVRRRSEVAPPP